MRRRISFALLFGLSFSACTAEPAIRQSFFEDIVSYCGKAYSGKLVSNDDVDADFANAKIVMHVRDCSADEVRIPLHVEQNRSRTWIITRTEHGMKLEHDHRHDDGSPDAITMYGGESITPGRLAFPADEESQAMFDREGIPVSKQNTWLLELDRDAQLFAYQMSRPNRLFRLEFDLSNPVEAPPPAWGFE